MRNEVNGRSFALAMLVLVCGGVTCSVAAAPATQPAFEIDIDTTQAPEMAPFAAQAREVALRWYPRIANELPSDDFVPPRRVTIVFKHADGIAYTSGDTITCTAKWFTEHPDDLGAIVHELVHVVQAYRHGHTPGWLVEGIADYVRWFEYEPVDHRPHPNPNRAKYNDSYRTTAAFLDWAQSKYNAQLVAALNAACRAGAYRETLWEQLTGKPLETLGEEWRQSLRQGPLTQSATRP